jgi:hypothetical protein
MTDSITPGWSCPTCGAEHLYDCPNLGPVAFLQAVMHATNLPVCDRLHAADTLLKLKAKGIYSDPVEPEPDYKVVIPQHPSLQ